MSTPLVEQKPFNGHTQGRLVFERHDHHASKYVGNLTVHMGSGSIRTVTCQLDYGSAEENEANAVFLAHCWNTYYQREAELQSMRDRLSRMEAALRRAQESICYAMEEGVDIGGTAYIDEALSNK